MSLGKLIQEEKSFAICPTCNGEGVNWYSGQAYDCRSCNGDRVVTRVIQYYALSKEDV